MKANRDSFPKSLDEWISPLSLNNYLNKGFFYFHAIFRRHSVSIIQIWAHDECTRISYPKVFTHVGPSDCLHLDHQHSSNCILLHFAKLYSLVCASICWKQFFRHQNCIQWWKCSSKCQRNSIFVRLTICRWNIAGKLDSFLIYSVSSSPSTHYLWVARMLRMLVLFSRTYIYPNGKIRDKPVCVSHNECDIKRNWVLWAQ